MNTIRSIICEEQYFSPSGFGNLSGCFTFLYMPSHDVRVDQPVRFRIWDQGQKVSNICIDIDEKALIQDYAPYSTFTHTFKTPGIHIVTATGKADNLPVMQKVKVVISE